MKSYVPLVATVLASGLAAGCMGRVTQDDPRLYDGTRIAAPVALTASQSFPEQISLTWQGVDEATRYNVFRGGINDGAFFLLREGVEDTTYVDTPLVDCLTYYYYVVAASDALGDSRPSNIATGKTTLARPGLPTASLGTYPDRIVITWETSPKAEEYSLETAPALDGAWSTLTTTTQRRYEHTPLAEGEVYYYRVVAHALGQLDSPASETVIGATGVLPDATLEAYVKAPNAEAGDNFGASTALSQDGNTLAIGAPQEASSSTGIGGDRDNNDAAGAGAVYVFVRSTDTWAFQAYLKASNTDGADRFGDAVTLSADGNTLAVGAPGEDSSASGVGGTQSDNTAEGSGAAYVFLRSGSNWSQQAYLKQSTTRAGSEFGASLQLSGDGNTLAVGAARESSNAKGINGDETDDSAMRAGAVYLFVRNASTWSHQAYIKTSDNSAGDAFGVSVGISNDGNTLAAGAYMAGESGAVGVFSRTGTTWTEEALVTPSASTEYMFGLSLAVSESGDTLAGGALNGVFLFERNSGTWIETASGGLVVETLALSGDGTLLALADRNESTDAVGVNGTIHSTSKQGSGAVFLTMNLGTQWSLLTHIKAPNADMSDYFGMSVSISGDGSTMAVGANGEGSNSTVIDSGQSDNSALRAGAVYVYSLP